MFSLRNSDIFCRQSQSPQPGLLAASWLDTLQLKVKLNYSPSTPNIQHQKHKGNQSRCEKYPPAFPHPLRIIPTSHWSWKRQSIRSLFKVDSQEILVSACHPGCCRKPTAFPLERKNSSWLLLKEPLMFLLGKTRQKDDPQILLRTSHLPAPAARIQREAKAIKSPGEVAPYLMYTFGIFQPGIIHFLHVV